MSSEFQEAGEIPNPLCIKCGKPCSETSTDMGRGTVYIHTDCKTQVIFNEKDTEGEEA